MALFEERMKELSLSSLLVESTPVMVIRGKQVPSSVGVAFMVMGFEIPMADANEGSNDDATVGVVTPIPIGI